MYAGENKEVFPPGWNFTPGGQHQKLGLGAHELYPDYWNDAVIKICPSDPRTVTTKGPHVAYLGETEEDISAQIQRISTAELQFSGTEEDRRACLMSILGYPNSYAYCPWAMGSASQLAEALYVNQTLVHRGGTLGGGGNAIVPPRYEYLKSEVDESCPELVWETYNELHSFRPNQDDISSGLIELVVDTLGPYNMDARIDDDGVSSMPSSYPRLREGVERFFITDINNPASGSTGQSTLPVMWDTWSPNWQGGDFHTGIGAFNHLPGGCNTLYMDGHVEFLRLDDEFPVISELEPDALGEMEWDGPTFWLFQISRAGGNW
jgi:prepilin-type processing-associated H-X9-DG protein